MGHHTDHALGSRLTDKGVDFCVWAPFATAVTALVGEPFNWVETPLENTDGYWHGFAEKAEAGQSYKYRIQTADGKTLEKNDPRARQLTASEEGVSVIIDPRYDWEEAPQPVLKKHEHILYELHIGTFNRPDAATSGTFYTAIEKLDYLQNLGVTTIELMPVTSMAMSNGWGYAPNYLFSVENTYGGRRGLLDFVKEAHKRNMAVILDVVYNHFFPESDIWQYDGWSENNRGGIYFYNNERGDTPWGGRPDYGRPEVRQFILDNVAMWLTEYKIDGLRVDSTIYMRNTKGPEGDSSSEIPEAWSLLQEMTELAKKINPNSLMVAEDSSVNDSITTSVEHGGAGFDAQWALAFPHTIRSMLKIEEEPYGNTVASELQHYYNADAFQKVIFSDSHDTAANGSVRLSEAASPGNAGSVFARQYGLLANAIMLTAPGIPMLLQGEEFMQTGSFNDWHMLEWDRATQFAGIVLAHQHLVHLRKNIYDNTRGLIGTELNVFHEDNSNNILAYHRWREGGPHDDVIVIVNASDQRFEGYKLYVPIAGTWHVRFNSNWNGYSPDFNETLINTVTTDENCQLTLELSDYNVLILAQDPEPTE
jgi:1,4-alpha-glucan branching enzyme